MGDLVVPIDKVLVANGFSRAAQSYDAAAHFQQQVATRLLKSIPESLKPTVVVDLGSGTGMHTAGLLDRYPEAMVTGCDLSWGMLEYARYQCPSARWCSGDAEALPFAENSIDLLFSSLAIQWCGSFSNVLREACQALRPGGRFVFSSLCAGTLQELYQAWQSIDHYDHVNPYPSYAEHCSMLEDSGFSVESVDLKPYQLLYPGVADLTRELAALGASTLTGERRQGLLTPGRYKQLQKAYEGFRNEQQLLPATYQVLSAVLRKE